MKTLCKSPRPPIPLSPSISSTASFLAPSSVRLLAGTPSPQLSLRASSGVPPSPRSPFTINLESISSIMIPPAAAAVAAVALLLPAFLLPSVAAAAGAPPAYQSVAIRGTLTEDETRKVLVDRLGKCPDDIEALRSLMEMEIKSDRLPAAIPVIERLIGLVPGDKDLPLFRCHVLRHAGDPDGARRGFEEIISGDPFLVKAYHGLVMEAPRPEDGVGGGGVGDLESILKRVESVMQACEEQGKEEVLRDFKLLVAYIRTVQGRYEDALKVYQGLVEEEPRDFRPCLGQGIVYSLMLNMEEAEKRFEEYQKLIPRNLPYPKLFDDSVNAMKELTRMELDRRAACLKV